ncbi:MAG TPA: nucleotidyltransferase domain-containing protein [Candidatus Nanoarchaeia archaeon]|nr:nucleotidyltransferase domain-containing protein [Candidatus Nanoarchaeia archaeon]
MKSKLVAYAMDVASFLVQKVQNRERIKHIILFGSVAREEAGEGSDIDIFVDVVEESPDTEKDIKVCIEKFHQSAKYAHYWKMLGIENEIKLKVGRLDYWDDLKPSIIANGITLYGKFKAEAGKGKHQALLVWENVKPNAKRVMLNKQMFGYTQGKKFYAGLIQKFRGERLGKGCISVPLEHALVFQQRFKAYRISVKIKKIIEYG